MKGNYSQNFTSIGASLWVELVEVPSKEKSGVGAIDGPVSPADKGG